MRLQWGRDQLVAEIFSLLESTILPIKASMGPRPIGRGNYRVRPRQDAADGELQWGRDQLVAEMLVSRRLDTLLPMASMGPRPIGRGNASRTSFFGSSKCCFNGAATNWSRKWSAYGSGSGNPSLLQWGRDQLVAEIVRRHPELDSAGNGFNGAATNWSRKLRV